MGLWDYNMQLNGRFIAPTLSNLNTEKVMNKNLEQKAVRIIVAALLVSDLTMIELEEISGELLLEPSDLRDKLSVTIDDLSNSIQQ